MEFFDELDERLDQAFDLTKRGLLEDAMEAVGRCLAEEPSHAGAHALRGYILVLQDQLDAAGRAAAKALNLDPDLAVAHFVRALVERARGQPNHAVASYHRAIELEPEDLGYQIELAETYFEAGREAEGRALLEEIKEVNPFGVEVLLLRAHVATLDGDAEEAASCAETAVKLDPQNPGARLVLARAALAREDPETAARHATQALTLEPENWDVLLLLTEALVKQGDHDAALAVIEEHAREGANAEIILCERARILLLAGRIAAAESATEQALQVAPRSVYLHHLQGQIDYERGDTPGAIAAYERAWELDPGDLGTVQQLVLVYSRMGDDSKIRQTIEKAGSAMSTDVSALLFLAALARETGHLHQARVCVGVALRREPDNIEARLQSAEFAVLLNDFAKARQEAERVLEQDPENKAAQDMITWLSSAKGLKKLMTHYALWVDRVGKSKWRFLCVFISLILFAVAFFGLMSLFDDPIIAIAILVVVKWVSSSYSNNLLKNSKVTPGHH